MQSDDQHVPLLMPHSFNGDTGLVPDHQITKRALSL